MKMKMKLKMKIGGCDDVEMSGIFHNFVQLFRNFLPSFFHNSCPQIFQFFFNILEKITILNAPTLTLLPGDTSFSMKFSDLDQLSFQFHAISDLKSVPMGGQNYSAVKPFLCSTIHMLGDIASIDKACSLSVK